MTASAPSPLPAQAARQPAPTFWIIAAFLAVAAAAFYYADVKDHWHFKKLPVPQPREFREISPVLGDWMQVSIDEKLDDQMEEYLGTDKYIYRDYIRVDQAGPDVLNYLAFKPAYNSQSWHPQPTDDPATNLAVTQFRTAPLDKQVRMLQAALANVSLEDRKKMVYALQLFHPSDVVEVGLTYYTGMADTVAHIPERCYIADGYEPLDHQDPVWTLTDPATQRTHPLKVRFVSFEDDTGSNRESKCVAYVFHCNGHYENDSTSVRIALQNLTQKSVYYAKIEMMTIGNNSEAAQEGMRDFLSDAQSQIELCFPNWDQVENK